MNKPLTEIADEDSLRVEFEISPGLKEELDLLKQRTGLSYPQLYSRGFTLFIAIPQGLALWSSSPSGLVSCPRVNTRLLRIYSDLKAKGIDIGYVDESGERRVVKVPGF